MAKKKRAKKTLKDHKSNYKHMVERYGHSCKWVDVQIHLTYDEMVQFFGEQCDEYEPLCGTCSNWVMWNKTGKAELSFEREELINLLK